MRFLQGCFNFLQHFRRLLQAMSEKEDRSQYSLAEKSRSEATEDALASLHDEDDDSHLPHPPVPPHGPPPQPQPSRPQLQLL